MVVMEKSNAPIDRQQLDTTLQSLNQQLDDLRRKQAEAAVQTQRIQRAVRLDEHELAVGKFQSERAMLEAITSLTTAVQGMVIQNIPYQVQVDQEGQALYTANKARRQVQVQANVAHDRYLSTLVQERTYLCPCGQHQGITFKDHKDVVIEENMCPRAWWIKLSKLAYVTGNLAQFNRDVPLAEFLKGYAIEDKAG